jgi:hypothetical protein
MASALPEVCSTSGQRLYVTEGEATLPEGQVPRRTGTSVGGSLVTDDELGEDVPREVGHLRFDEMSPEEWMSRLDRLPEKTKWNDLQVVKFLAYCYRGLTTIREDGQPILLDADLALAFFTWQEGGDGSDPSGDGSRRT